MNGGKDYKKLSDIFALHLNQEMLKYFTNSDYVLHLNLWNRLLVLSAEEVNGN